jgi:hypothetical protein
MEPGVPFCQPSGLCCSRNHTKGKINWKIELRKCHLVRYRNRWKLTQLLFHHQYF